jgi:hypothetical protein
MMNELCTSTQYHHSLMLLSKTIIDPKRTSFLWKIIKILGFGNHALTEVDYFLKIMELAIRYIT